ncbi:MAG: hypothetical protein WCS37_13275, partial [Chloroflexota bacterium]
SSPSFLLVSYWSLDLRSTAILADLLQKYTNGPLLKSGGREDQLAEQYPTRYGPFLKSSGM